MKERTNCIQLGMIACCYCCIDGASSQECLINKMVLAINHHGIKDFFIKCKPIIDFAHDDVLRYVIKCVELYYPEHKDKLHSLLILL
jgi:hypothetical protein